MAIKRATPKSLKAYRLRFALSAALFWTALLFLNLLAIRGTALTGGELDATTLATALSLTLFFSGLLAFPAAVINSRRRYLLGQVALDLSEEEAAGSLKAGALKTNLLFQSLLRGALGLAPGLLVSLILVYAIPGSHGEPTQVLLLIVTPLIVVTLISYQAVGPSILQLKQAQSQEKPMRLTALRYGLLHNCFPYALISTVIGGLYSWHRFSVVDEIGSGPFLANITWTAFIITFLVGFSAMMKVRVELHYPLTLTFRKEVPIFRRFSPIVIILIPALTYFIAWLLFKIQALSTVQAGTAITIKIVFSALLSFLISFRVASSNISATYRQGKRPRLTLRRGFRR